MPIIDIQLVGATQPIPPGLTRQLAEAISAALNSRPRGTWVKLHRIPEEQYAENARGDDDAVSPVFVYVLQRQLPDATALKQQTRSLTAAVASVCGMWA